MENLYNISRRTLIMGASASVITLGLNVTGVAADSLDGALAPRVLGNADAPIVMAEYFSLSCSHCADFHHGAFKDIKTNWIDTGKLRFDMRDFPLRGPAIYAHALARSVPINAYPKMIDLLFKKQREWAASDDPVGALARIARIAGIGQDKFTDIIQNRALLEGIVSIAQDGYDRFEINSTPSFVINDDKVLRGSGDYDRFLKALNEIAA